jgi:hypothetical protein
MNLIFMAWPATSISTVAGITGVSRRAAHGKLRGNVLVDEDDPVHHGVQWCGRQWTPTTEVAAGVIDVMASRHRRRSELRRSRMRHPRRSVLGDIRLQVVGRALHGGTLACPRRYA